MMHFWNTLTLRKVQLPTDVSRLNCVFERNGDMIPRAQLFVNSTGEKSRVRGVITKWDGGGGHISLSCQLPVKL